MIFYRDFKLLSFGEEAEDDEEETTVIIKKIGSKSKSAHDNLLDPKLSSTSVIDAEEPLTKKVKKDEENSSDEEHGSIKGEDKAAKEKQKV